MRRSTLNGKQHDEEVLMLGKGKSVQAKRDLRWRGETIRAGSKGTVITESMWSPKFTVTFKQEGFLGDKFITVEDLTADDIEER